MSDNLQEDHNGERNDLQHFEQDDDEAEDEAGVQDDDAEDEVNVGDEEPNPIDQHVHELLGLDDEQILLRLYFSMKCDKIRLNDPALTDFLVPLLLDDHWATHLGHCLHGNRHLASLTIHPGPEMTAGGAALLVQGIAGSNIRSLRIETADTAIPIELSRLYAQIIGIPTIESLDLIFVIDDAHVTQLGKALQGNESLKTLSIAVEAFTLSGARDFAIGLRRSHISKLNLVARTNASVPPMRELFLNGIRQSPYLVDLVMCGIVGYMPAVAAVIPKLHAFTIAEPTSFPGFNADHVRLLTHGLRQAKQLKSVRISLSDWGNEEKLRLLFRGLFGKHPSIQQVELVGLEGFGDEAVATLLEHWSSHSSIQSLDLGGSKIGPMGALSLIRAVPMHPQFIILNLNDNERIGYDGLALIGKELAGKRLLDLNLSSIAKWVDYDDVTCEEAVKQASKRAMASRALLEGMRGNTYLQRLDLKGLNLLPEAIAEIDVYRKANNRGRHFLFKQYKDPPGIWSVFLAAQKSNDVLFVFLRELPNVMAWRQKSS